MSSLIVCEENKFEKKLEKLEGTYVNWVQGFIWISFLGVRKKFRTKSAWDFWFWINGSLDNKICIFPILKKINARKKFKRLFLAISMHDRFITIRRNMHLASVLQQRCPMEEDGICNWVGFVCYYVRIFGHHLDKTSSTVRIFKTPSNITFLNFSPFF